MRRLIDWHLKKWKTDPRRKPLIIRGARQIGKTFSVRVLGKEFPHFLEVNFEKVKEAKKIFEKNLEPERIVMELKALFQKPIVPGETLLFFDEIQECPEALISLRYFFENMPELHVIAAGSLLDFAIEKVGIPVGRVSTLYFFPLSFIEFLVAMGYSLAADAILKQEKGVPLSDVIHTMLMDLLGQYLAIGGLPEAVALWVKTKDPLEIQKVHHRIADTYVQDFEKYAKKHQIKYLDALFNQIPFFQGKQFKYNQIHGSFQKRELAPCLDLLCKANIVHKVHHSAGNGLPLGAEINMEWFKLVFLDVALGQSILGADIAAWFLRSKEAFSNQGQLIEAFVGQELLCYSMSYGKPHLYFWKRDKRGSQAEVDYIFAIKGEIIPIEAKNTDGNTLKSLRLFLEEHPKSPFGIRFCSLNYSFVDKIDSRPLYSLASIAHDDQKESLHYLVKND